MLVGVWVTVCVGLAECYGRVGDEGMFVRTKEIFEFGRLALALLEVAAEDDLLAVFLSFGMEWCGCDCCD